MNPSQTKAVARIHHHVTSNLNTTPEYGDQVTKWEVTETDYGHVMISAETEMMKLGEGNLLRALDHKFYLFFIGKHGKISMKMGPKSYKQFNGRKVFGFHVDV
jgi:hypothetical protein